MIILALDELPEELESVANYDLEYLCLQRNIKPSTSGINMRENLEKWRSRNRRDKHTELSSSKALKTQFCREWLRVLPLRREREIQESIGTKRARKAAAQEAAKVVRDSMSAKWNLLLFSAAASGRKLEHIKKVVGTESLKERERKPVQKYALRYYRDQPLVEMCAEFGDFLGGWNSMNKTSDDYIKGTCQRLAKMLAEWCTSTGRKQAANDFSLSAKESLAKDLYRHSKKLPCPLGNLRQKMKQYFLKDGTPFQFGGFNTVEYDSRTVRSKTLGMETNTDDPAIVTYDTDTHLLTLHQLYRNSLSFQTFYQNNYVYIGNLLHEVPSDTREEQLRFRVFDVRWVFAQHMYRMRDEGALFSLLPEGIYEIEYHGWGDGTPAMGNGRTDLEYNFVENPHVTIKANVLSDASLLHKWTSPLKICHVWSKETQEVYEIAARIETQDSILLSSFIFYFEDDKKHGFVFINTGQKEDFKAAQMDNGSARGGQDRYPFRHINLTDPNVQYWPKLRLTKLRTLAEAWHDFQSGNTTNWARPPTRIAAFFTDRVPLLIPAGFYSQVNRFVVADLLSLLRGHTQPLSVWQKSQEIYQRKLIDENSFQLTIHDDYMQITASISCGEGCDLSTSIYLRAHSPRANYPVISRGLHCNKRPPLISNLSYTSLPSFRSAAIPQFHVRQHHRTGSKRNKRDLPRAEYRLQDKRACRWNSLDLLLRRRRGVRTCASTRRVCTVQP